MEKDCVCRLVERRNGGVHKMKKAICGIAAFFLAGFLSACADDENEHTNATEAERESPEETAETSADGNGGFLWKVTNGDTDVYLQGTIHIGDEDFYPLNVHTEQAYEQADVVMPEINLLDQGSFEQIEQIMSRAVFQGDTTLSDVLPQETYNELEAILANYEIGIAEFSFLQPWFVDMTLQGLGVMESNLDEQYGVDMYFLERAQEDGKEIVELESVELQFDVLSSNSMETQVDMLTANIEQYDKLGSNMDQLAERWLAGDEGDLLDFLEQSEQAIENEEYMEALIDNRDVAMAETISEVLAEDSGETYFVFVGTYHLLSDPSIITELEDKGYDVESIY